MVWMIERTLYLDYANASLMNIYVFCLSYSHGETPSKEQTQTFINVCHSFISRNPLSMIGRLHHAQRIPLRL